MAGVMGAYRFDSGEFVEYADGIKDGLDRAAALEEQGFGADPQVWGNYPNAYVSVYEARPGAASGFAFVAVVVLVSHPHRIYLKNLGELVRLLGLLAPVFSHHRPDALSTGDALFGTQGADFGPSDTSSG